MRSSQVWRQNINEKKIMLHVKVLPDEWYCPLVALMVKQEL